MTAEERTVLRQKIDAARRAQVVAALAAEPAKECSICHAVKTLDEFPNIRWGAQCRACRSEKRRQRDAAKPKVCRGCLEKKPLSDFGPEQHPSWRYCLECAAVRVAA